MWIWRHCPAARKAPWIYGGTTACSQVLARHPPSKFPSDVVVCAGITPLLLLKCCEIGQGIEIPTFLTGAPQCRCWEPIHELQHCTDASYANLPGGQPSAVAPVMLNAG